MSASANDLWPWFAIATLGLFHGLNPAMGWLFAVALGLHHHSRRVVLISLAPIVVGHALAVAAAVAAVLMLGLVLDTHLLRRAAGVALIGWAIWHALRGHRQPVRIGMQAGLGGLALWSFMISAAHGAGLMLIPALAPICLSGPASANIATGEAMTTAAAAISTHTATMLVATVVTAITVYEWAGLAFLRWAWINVDLIWVGALGVSGTALLLM